MKISLGTFRSRDPIVPDLDIPSMIVIANYWAWAGNSDTRQWMGEKGRRFWRRVGKIKQRVTIHRDT